MLSVGAIEKLYSPDHYSIFQPILQIISVQVVKSGYILKISDERLYTKIFYPNHSPIPILNSIIFLEEYELIPYKFLLILCKYKTIQPSIKLGEPEKYKFSHKSKAPFIFTPIKSLNYGRQNFILKVRIIEKTPVEVNTAKNQKFFKALLCDENNDNIEAFFYNDLVDLFYAILLENKLYLFSGGIIKKSLQKPRYSKHSVHLIVNEHSKIIEIFDDNSIKYEKYNFISIKAIYKFNTSKRLDTCGIVTSFTNNGLLSLEIIDLSNCSIQLFCSNFNLNCSQFSVIVCKNVQYEPLSNILISDSSSVILINPPDLPELKPLQE